MKQKWTTGIKNEYRYDVVVIGGGTTGCAAAFAAARRGAKTAIVESYGFLGGNAANGLPWLGFHGADKQLIVGGIPLEIVRRCGELGGATNFLFDPICKSAVGVNGACLKIALSEMAEAEKADCFLHSLAVGVERNGPSVSGVFIQNREGCHLLRCRFVIDCTDTGDAAAFSGCSFDFGRKPDSKPQVSSGILCVGNIDFQEMLHYFERRPDQMRPFAYDEKTMRNLIGDMRRSGVFILGAFPELVAQAKKEGVSYPRDRLIGAAFPQWNELLLVASRVENVDPNNAKNFSSAEFEALRQQRAVMQFVNRYMPGGKSARIVYAGHQIGIRETRHFHGDYFLTAEDILNGKAFEDPIALGGYHLDIHSPDDGGLRSRQPPTYQIPYRALLPRGADNLLLAGRCICASHEAMSSTRVIPISAALGQAAGTAAALAAADGVRLRELSYSRLRTWLLEDQAILEI